MPQEDIIAKRYARGLAELAEAEGRVDEVREDLLLLADLVDVRGGGGGVPELLDFLGSPTPSMEDKQAVARRILDKAGIGKTVTDFMGLLIAKGRVELVPRINRIFLELAGQLTGDLPAFVSTARPLTEEQKSRLATALTSTMGTGVKIRQQVDPGLLAGIRVTVGGRTFDGTVLGKLERLKHRLTRGMDTAEIATPNE